MAPLFIQTYKMIPIYNIKLRRGDIVRIYLNPKEDRKYEGKARLIEKLEEGNSFYEDYERLYVPDYYKTSIYNVDKRQIKLNKIHDRLEKIFSSKSKEVKSIYSKLKNQCSKKPTSYNKMIAVVNSHSSLYEKESRLVATLLNEFEGKHIVRYVQQKHLKHWTPTLFKLERWKVELLPKTKFDKPFITNRWIKVLIKICPIEDVSNEEISQLTTYNKRKITSFKIIDSQ